MDNHLEGVGAGLEQETPGWEESVPAPSRRLQVCHHCGRDDVGSYEAGSASLNSFPVCHPNVEGRPDCYMLVTIGHHEMPCLDCMQLPLPLETG